MTDFEKELAELINKHSKEGGSDTPDFILAQYVSHCLRAFDIAVQCRTGHAANAEAESRNQRAIKHYEGTGGRK